MKLMYPFTLIGAACFLVMAGCASEPHGGHDSSSPADASMMTDATSVTPKDDVSVTTTPPADVAENPWADVDWSADSEAPQSDTVAVNPPQTDAGGVTLPDGHVIYPEGKGSCDNLDDMNALFALEDINGVMRDCAIDCMGKSECAADCVEDASGVSAGCADCFAGSISCTMDHCIFNCMDATSEKCQTCQEEHCTDDFVVCAGLNPDLQ